jgi:hypothetical protein
MRNIGNLGAVAAAICLLALPLTAHAQGTSGEAARGAERRGHAAAPIGAAGLLSADQRVRFREYAVRRHRATPYSFREPVTVGTVLPPRALRNSARSRHGVRPHQYADRFVKNSDLLAQLPPATAWPGACV